MDGDITDRKIQAMMATSISREWNELTETERILIKWQKQMYGAFYMKLMDAIACADVTNQTKLEQAFPDEVFAMRLWQHTWIGESLRKRGLI